MTSDDARPRGENNHGEKEKRRAKLIGVIAKREILEYLKSAKFLIGLGITLAITIISTAINIQDFKQRQQDFMAARKEMKGTVFNVMLYRPPQVLSILVQGKDRILGNQIEMTYLDIPIRPSGYMGERYSQPQRSASGFGAVDFAFLVRVVLSLMVIFLAYNAVSEEKSLGTLKLVLANSVPRHQILLGKFLAGLTIVLGSLLTAAVLSVLIMVFQSFLALMASDWLRILSLVAASALYLITFYTLSLFISVAVNRPSIALMILLQLWIFLVVIYPHLGVDAAENFFRLPSDRELSQKQRAAFQPYQEEFKKVTEAYFKGDESKQTGHRYLELEALKSQKDYDVEEEFDRQLTRQRKLAQNLSILSPAVLYDQMAARYARTGIDEYERFMENVVRFWQTPYMELQKLRFENLEAYRKAQVPAFSSPAESTGDALISTLPQCVILFLLISIFFALAYTTFLRKDVR